MPRKKSSKPTLAKVAAAAGVSVSQASDALRGLGRVSDDTREEVFAAAQALGYRAQGAARSLRTGVRPLLVVHMDYGTTHGSTGTLLPFWSNMLVGLIAGARELEYGVIVDIGGTMDDLSRLPGQALLFFSTDPTKVQVPDDLGFGAVLGFAIDPDQIPSAPKAHHTVSLCHHDYRQAGADAATFFAGAGRRNLLVVLRGGSHAYLGHMLAGIQEVADATGIAVSELQLESDQEQVSDEIGARITGPNPVDAVLDLSLSSASILEGVATAGRSCDIGDPACDVMVICQSELPGPQFRDPRIGYLSYEGMASGHEIAENIVSAISGRPPDIVTLPYRLYVGG